MPPNAAPIEEMVEARRRVSNALVELNRAVNKIGMYPRDHPLVPAAIQLVKDAVDAALSGQSQLRLGVSKGKILLEGEPLDEKNASVRWVARSLHEGGIALIELTPRAGPDDLLRLVNWLARSRRPGDGGVMGLELAEANLQGIEVELVDYARLAFKERTEDGAVHADAIWDTLASALLHGLPAGQTYIEADEIPRAIVGRGGGTRPPRETAAPTSPEVIAARLGSAMRRTGPQSGERVSSELIAVGRQFPQMQPDVRDDVKRRLAALITHLSPDLQRQLMKVSPGVNRDVNREKLEFLSEMADLLPESLVIDALGDVDRARLPVSGQFLTLLSKFSNLTSDRKAPERVKSREETAIPIPHQREEDTAEILREVFTHRDLGEHTPAPYQELLTKISEQRAPATVHVELDARYRDPRELEDLRVAAAGIGAHLIVEGLSEGSLSELMGYVTGVAMEMLRAGRFEEVYRYVGAARWVLAREAPEEARQSAETIILNLRRDDVIDKLLEAVDSAPEEALRALSELFVMTGSHGAVRMINTLSVVAGPSRERRIRLLNDCEPEALVEGFGRFAEEDVDGLRGVVPLLRRIPVREAIVIAQKLTSHWHPGIRIEAYRTLAHVDRHDGALERCLESALWDSDSQVGAAVLGTLKGRISEATCGILGRYIAGQFGLKDERLHIEALCVLAESPTTAARDVLIRVLLSGRYSFRNAHMRLRVEAERALLLRTDAVSRRALRLWQRSPAYWASLLVVRRHA